MVDPPTCGQGLADHSVLPAKLGELTASVAETLEAHVKALDLEDESSRTEYDAYQELAKAHREIARQLLGTAERMAGYRDLPMGRHDPKAMSAPEARAAFEKLVRLEQELLALLQGRVEQHRELLGQWIGG